MNDSNRLSHIQGLRGVSILLILLFHAGFVFRGGFIGVDIFFVISGFVITRMLMRQELTAGKVSWSQFFYNRARRILPSLSIVTALTFLAAISVFNSPERTAVAKGVFPVMLFSSNAYFFFKNDYLALHTDVFTHMWSLAVEEQFYLALPAIYFLLRLKKIRNVKKLQLLPIFSALFVVSFGLTIALTNFSQVLAIPSYLLPARFGFFGTPARIWEILTGSIGALVANTWHAESTKIKSITYISGFAVVFSAYFLDSWMSWPGINAVPIVIATIFLVMFGDQVGGIAKVLNFKFLIWLGEMSYNLYLVHWPIMVLMKFQFGGSTTSRVFAILLSIPIAQCMYSWLDKPIRAMSERKRSKALMVVGVLVLLPIITSASYLLISHDVKDATAVGENTLPYYSLGSNACVDSNIATFERNKCMSGSPSSKDKLLLIGDSHAASISEVVISTFLKIHPDGSVFVWSKSGCPFIIDNNTNRECDSNRDFILKLIKTEQPSEIIIANAVIRYLSIENINDLPFGLKTKIRNMGNAYRRTFEVMNQLRIPVHVVNEVPYLEASLGTKRRTLSKVEIKISKMFQDQKTGFQNVSLIDLSTSICPSDKCSRVVNGIEIYLEDDPEHLTGSGAMRLESQFAAIFSF
jgi:peptidoglycan/LPS O-acetylase OafA/YrhL